MATTRNLRDGQLQLKDGATPTPNALTLDLLEGNLTWSVKTNVITVLDRGTIDHQRAGDDSPMEISFSAKVVNLSDVTTPTLYDALHKYRSAAGWTSTETDSDLFHLNLNFTLDDPTDASAGTDEHIAFGSVAVTSFDFSEGDEYSTVAVSLISKGTRPTFSVADLS